MSSAAGSIRLPDAPVLVAGFAGAAWLETTGEVQLLAPADAARRVARVRPILCHGPATARRLGTERFAAFDLLELFAFVRPAQFCLPTPRGLAAALDIAVGPGLAAEAAAAGPDRGRRLRRMARPQGMGGHWPRRCAAHVAGGAGRSARTPGQAAR